MISIVALSEEPKDGSTCKGRYLAPCESGVGPFYNILALKVTMTLPAKGYLSQNLGVYRSDDGQFLDDPSYALANPDQDGPACSQIRFDTESMGNEA